MTVPDEFDFDKALEKALDLIDIGPHCSCADITMELLRENLPLRWDASRYAASAFGGGIGGSGGPCGAFCAGLIALSLSAGHDEPAGCIAELVEEPAQRYYDEWIEEYGSILCAELTGYPSLRAESAREAFFAAGGADRCTQRHIRFAVEEVLQMAAARPGS
jgi:C_GCAxxG_C_C family probable redox protein